LLKASLAAAALATALAAPAPGIPASSLLGGAGGFVSPFIDAYGNNVPGVSGGVATSSYFGLTTADLLTATNGNCNYLETAAVRPRLGARGRTDGSPLTLAGRACRGKPPRLCVGNCAPRNCF